MTAELQIRKLTDSGIEAFRGYLAGLRAGTSAEPPYELLSDPKTSRSIKANGRIVQHQFKTRLDAARYFSQELNAFDEIRVASNVHLWSWLSLFYFDQVCPPDSTGKRKPGRDYRHILEPGYPNGHRHLLGGAYLVYTVYGWTEEILRLLLCTPLHVESKFHHELAGRQSLITNKGIMEAACRLYYNPALEKPKRGAQIKKGAPGTFYRFIDVVQQLDLNYDLYSMTGEEIISILPGEFDQWKRNK